MSFEFKPILFLTLFVMSVFAEEKQDKIHIPCEGKGCKIYYKSEEKIKKFKPEYKKETLAIQNSLEKIQARNSKIEEVGRKKFLERLELSEKYRESQKNQEKIYEEELKLHSATGN